jgi:thioesterase domain-containing protein
VARVGRDDTFFDLGGNSLGAVRLVHAIHAAFGVRIGVRDIFEAPDLASMARRLDDTTEDRNGVSCLVPLREAGEETPLFLIHPVGGAVLCYMPLLRAADIGGPVYGLQREGIDDGGEARYLELADMAERYLAEIRARQPAGPYRLAGWSMGGVIAATIAETLLAAGEQVAFLGMIDSRFRAAVGLDVADGDDAGGAPMFERLCAALDDPQVRDAFDSSQQLTGMAKALDDVEMARIWRIHAAGIAAARAHAPPRRLPVRAVYYAAESNAPDVRETSVALLRAAGARVDERMIPGTHHSMMLSPNVDALAALLSADLAATQDDNTQENRR